MNLTPLELLTTTHPFASLPQQTLGEAATRVRPLALAASETLTLDGPDDSVAVVLVVSGTLALTIEADRVDTLIPGDTVGFERFFDPKDVDGHQIVAIEDCTLLAFSAPLFKALLDHDRFRVAFAQKNTRLCALVENAAANRAKVGADPFLRLAVKSAGFPPPLFVPAGMRLAEAARRMFEAQAAACLVGKPSQPLGIVTERDALKALGLHGAAAADMPVETLMTTDLVTVKPDDALFEAFAKMAKHNIRRLVVTAADGSPSGLIQERDLLSARGENPVYLAGEIITADAEATLARCLAKLRSMTLRAVAEGIDVDRVGRLISTMHDQIMQRVAVLLLAAQPAKDFALAALGSEGRREQFLATDQDNALIVADQGAPDAHSTFAVQFIQSLVTIGFPPCPSKVMADNPDWRRTLSGWKDAIDTMLRTADSEAVLRISLLVDARHVYGDPELTAGLREHLFRRAKSAPVILKYMAREALRFSPPLGFFNNFVLEKSGPAKGCLDIKKGGVFPITQAAKTLALDNDLASTSTTGRLDALCDGGVLSAAMVADVKEAYSFMQTLRVRFQAENIHARLAPDNYVRPDRLSGLERDRLKDCFKIVTDLQALLTNKYGLRLLT